MLAGCGKKSADDVVADLNQVVGKLGSYQGSGKMILQTGQEPLEYHVEVWYKEPHFYRIALTNEDKDITQIVLRNDDGVFVLTPHLNKMFRFQSDWPENSGQVYLYQSLVQSILMDKQRRLTTDGDSYVFDVAANYQNASLVRQKVWLKKKNYAPEHVEVSDENNSVVVVVEFTRFEFGSKFEKDSFDMQRNMTSWKLESLPAISGMNGMSGMSGMHDNKSASANAVQPENSTSAQLNQSVAKQTNKSASAQQSFGVIEPSYQPDGVKKMTVSDLQLGENAAVLLRYSGKYNYTLLESRPTSVTVLSSPGDIVNLGFTQGVIAGEKQKVLMWTYDGVEYRLSTGDLPLSEMIKVAQSVQGQIGK